MATYVYNISDGSLYTSGISDDINQVIIRPTPLSDYGLAFKTGLLPPDSTHTWNSSTESITPVSAKVQTGLPPDLTDYPKNIAATGYIIQLPTDVVTYNLTNWAQPNLQAFHDFCVTLDNWDKSLHSQFWIYLQSKVTS